MSIIIGIDVGGSTTKIVGFSGKDAGRSLIQPQLVTANDPLPSASGAVGSFTDGNKITISKISKILITGVGSSFVKGSLYGLDCQRVDEFDSIGRGGIFLSGLDNALVVSMGTGTAIVHARSDGYYKYLGGTGVGGGTLMGLSKLLVGAESTEHIAKYADGGSLDNIDLRIKDMTASDSMTSLARDMTASNFAAVSDLATKEDIALGVMNMVFETVAMVSMFAARSVGVTDIVLTGNVTEFDFCKRKFAEINNMRDIYGVNFIIPEYSRFATVIGAALCGIDGGSK